MRCWLNLLIAFAVLLPAAVIADETEQYNQIRELLSGNKLDEAEKLFEAALAENPDSTRIKSLRYMMYYYNNRAERSEAALAHITAHVDDQLASAEKSPAASRMLPRYVDIMLSTMVDQKQTDQARKKLADISAAIEQLNRQREEADSQLLSLALALSNREITFLAETGEEKKAGKLLEERLAAAEKAVAAKPDDAIAQLKAIMLGKARSELLANSDAKAASAARDEYLAELFEAAKKFSDSAPLAVAALDNGLETAGSLTRKAPLDAEKLLKQVSEFADSLESDDATVKSRLASLERSVPSIERSIEAGKVHVALLGKDSFPLEVDAWANGMPLDEEDLKGKVVLLDFWAVWCGPCIATFPHLREWREKYADKGLVIIGVTRYYSYGWDEENSRPQRKADLSPEDELKAMEQFAAHHELKHRFLVVPKESTFQDNYGVTGIPQAVVIDQQGKIRLIRVGSGDANAHDIDQLLAELLGDKENAGGE